MTQVTVDQLDYAEQSLGEVAFPKKRLRLTAGFGSGLATRPGAPAGEVWAISDRGPNLKPKDARHCNAPHRHEIRRHVDGGDGTDP